MVNRVVCFALRILAADSITLGANRYRALPDIDLHRLRSGLVRLRYACRIRFEAIIKASVI